MASTSVAFALDQATIKSIETAAKSLAVSRSEVVRRAIRDFECQHKPDRLTEPERLRMLAVFDEVIMRIPKRDQREVDQELKEIRRSRRSWGRRSPV